MPNPPAAAADFSKLRRVSIIVVIAFSPWLHRVTVAGSSGISPNYLSRAYDWPGGPVWQGNLRSLRYVAAGLPAENIYIRSPFLGGVFGSKGLSAGWQILGSSPPAGSGGR
jgi:hypothetical protein